MNWPKFNVIEAIIDALHIEYTTRKEEDTNQVDDHTAPETSKDGVIEEDNDEWEWYRPDFIYINNKLVNFQLDYLEVKMKLYYTDDDDDYDDIDQSDGDDTTGDTTDPYSDIWIDE